MNLLCLAVFVAVMTGLYFVASHIEIRRDRWWRLLLTAPFMWILTDLFLTPISVWTPFFVPVVVICCVIFAMIWRDPFAHHISRFIVRVIAGDGRGGGGFRLDLRHSHTLIKEGKYEEARKEIEQELRKSHADYEGRLLLASLDCHLKKPQAALESLDILKRSPWLTEEQKAEVQRARDEVNVLMIQLNDNRQRGII